MHKLVYTDEQDLRIYESLPSTDFKEFFMAYFKYKKGDKVELTDFTNPVTFALFNSYIPKLDKNEDTYNKKVQANKENGKKGGRPKKSTITEVKTTEFDIPNCQIPNTADLSPSNNEEVEQPQPTIDNTTEAIKTTIEETIPNEFMEGLTDNTEEVEFDNFSETFNKWLDDGKEEKLMEMATNIVKYEYMGLKVAKTAYELAKTRFQQMLESLDGQDEKDMLCRHFDELLMLKKENYKEFIKVA